MKKAIRILVPILLVFAILASAAWYLFVYDRAFTRDLMLRQARRFEASGNHKLAAYLYDLTYAYSSNDEDIAIELAEQYKAAGNYTKAEYTLSRAIADGGGSKLYVALCKTYVEQDKLLDAVNMLDSITEPAIREALDAMRPEMPTVDKAPGFYNQYISVSVSAASGTLYATSNGVYPSTADQPYAEPISLPGGETTIYALAVAPNGLVSKLGIYGYTIGGVVEPVTLADPAFDSAIRTELGVGSDAVIYSDSLWNISSFEIPSDATDYSDLSRLPYLKSLTVSHAAAGQLTNLSSLLYLEELTLTDSAPNTSELTAIAGLPHLRKLVMQRCNLSSISPLSAAQNLEYLDLSDNAVRNITALSGAQKLQQLFLAHNALTDLSPLSNLKEIKTLDVSYNSLTSMDAISSLSALTELNISNNQLESLGNVQDLNALSSLNAGYNRLTNVDRLASCAQLSTLDISNNELTDISALGALTKVTLLNFSYNQVTALPEFSKDCGLVTIDGSHNAITSVEPLSGLENLNNVLLDYNPDLESLEPLQNCPVLILVNVYGTAVTDVSFLTAQSIIVNFDPTL